MSIYGTFVVCCDAHGCDAEADCGVGDEDGAHVAAAERGWLVQHNGYALCPKCRSDQQDDGPSTASVVQSELGRDHLEDGVAKPAADPE